VKKEGEREKREREQEENLSNSKSETKKGLSFERREEESRDIT